MDSRLRGNDIFIRIGSGVVAQFGRAPAWHAGGQGFNPPQLHHKNIICRKLIFDICL